MEWVLGDHSAKTFQPLWELVGSWKCYFFVTDGWPVYPMFIPDGDQIICKTYLTRVEGENTRLRHPERSTSSQDALLFKVERNAGTFS
jgi:insertion element IS1 protein InsB